MYVFKIWKKFKNIRTWLFIILKQSVCNTRHWDRSSDDDYDEMDDKFNDNSAT